MMTKNKNIFEWPDFNRFYYHLNVASIRNFIFKNKSLLLSPFFSWLKKKKRLKGQHGFVCARNTQWLNGCCQKLHFRIHNFELRFLSKQFQSRKILKEAPSPSIHPHHLPGLPRALSLHCDPETMETCSIITWQLACLCTDPPVKTVSPSADVLCLDVSKSPVYGLSV